jgi:magnesium transporter
MTMDAPPTSTPTAGASSDHAKDTREYEFPLAETLDRVVAALEAEDDAAARALVMPLKAPDLAEVIERLPQIDRLKLIQWLGADFDYEVLSEVGETVRDELSEALPNALIAKAVTELETDDAAYVMEGLEASDQQEVLAQVPRVERVALERNLDYPEESVGRMMQADFVAVPPYWSVGQVIDHMRESPDLPESFSDIFVVDAMHRVVGSLDLSRLLRTKRHVAISTITDTGRHVMLATEDQEKVAREFERYDLRSAPVVDANDRLVGVVTVDDVVEVIGQEADKDAKRLAGVGDERLGDSVREIAPSRFTWLFVNLITAVVASAVIKVFDATIEQMVALAVLMPIVASMGGNAGTQTMTVAVRALATNQLPPNQIPRFVLRETAVGLLNGLLFALILAAVAVIWYGAKGLGIVIGAAIIINLLAAAVAGIFFPLILHRYKFDPAVASTVFVTTVTDVVGYFAFLGLAAVWLKYWS